MSSLNILMIRKDWTVESTAYNKLNLSNAICYDRYLTMLDINYNLFQIPNEYLVYKEISNFHNIPMQNISIGFGLGELLPRIFKIFKNLKFKLVVPTWVLAEYTCQINHTIYTTIQYTDFINLDISELYNNNNSEVLYIANPNGVNGQALTRDQILRLCKIYKLVIVDEAYADFCDYNCSVLHDAVVLKNLIVAKSFSKSLASPGLRLGYCVASENITDLIQEHRPGYVVSSVASVLVPILLKEHSAHVKRMLDTKKYLESNFKVLPSQSNSVLFKENPNFNCVTKEVHPGIYRMALVDMETLVEIRTY